MSAFGETNEASIVDHTSLIVRDVSDDQNFAYLLSAHGETPTTGGFNTGSQSLSDTAMELIRMSPTRNILVLSPKSLSGSPGLNLEDLNSSGHQIVFLNHQSKTSLAENILQTKINIQTLTICFQYMKSLKHWRRRLKSVVFFALRRWAISSQYLRTSHHKAHQQDLQEQRKSLALLVSHHTASTKAKAVEKNERSASSKARDSTSKPSFRPTNINPTLQIQTNRTAIPATANNAKKSARGSPSRLKLQESVDKKDFQSDNATVVSTSSKSRSTTPTLLTAKVSALASHPFYQQAQPRSKSATLHQRNVPAEPGFDHKPLAVTNLTARADAAIQALATRVFVNSPERLMHTHSANTSATYSPGLAASTVESLSSPEQPRTLLRSPLQAFQESRRASPTSSLTLSQRIIPTRPHLTGTTSSTNMRYASSPSRFLNRSLAQQTLVSPKQSSLVHSPTRDSTVTSYGSPSAAEIAYARSRGSTASLAGIYDEPKQVHELEQEQISPSTGNALSRSQNTTAVFDMENANLGTQSEKEKKSVVLPTAPRRRGSGSKLQSALHQHRAHQHSNLRSRSSTPVDQDSPINEQNSSVAVAAVTTTKDVLPLDPLGSGELEDCGRFAVSEIKTSGREIRNKTRQVKTDLPSSKQSPVMEQTEYDVMVFSSDEHAENADNAESDAPSRIRHSSVYVKPSKHYTYLVFKKLQQKIVHLQELKTFELHAALPAMDSHYKRCLCRIFAALRAMCLGARRAHSVATLAKKNFLYLAFRRLQRKILQQQEMKDSEKHASLPASHFYKHRRVRRSFDFLRTKHLEAKISQYRSYQSAINIDNYALVKAFWRLRKNVTHRHQSWFIEQRGVKYHRFLRMSQGFSALAQIAAYGNVPFSGDEGSLHGDIAMDEADHSHAASSLVQSLRAHEEDYEFHSSDSDSDGEPELNVRSDILPEDCEVRSFSDSEEEKENNLSEVHDLSLWEDRHFDELSLSQAGNSSDDDNSVTEPSVAHKMSPPAMHSYDRFYEDDEHSESSTEHESFAIGTIAALGLRSVDNSPTPRSPLPETPTTAAAETTATTSTAESDVYEKFTLAAPVPSTVVAFGSLARSARSSPPHDMLPQPPSPDLHQAESLRNISRSRSDEFPGVSGLDMWDWQDLHSVSREFISDSECDSSLGRSLSMSTEEVLPRRSVTPISSRTPSPLMGIAPAPVHARPEVVANWARRLSSVVDSMSPIFAHEDYSTSPPLPAHNYEHFQYDGEENESDAVHRMDPFSAFGAERTGSESDLSLFLSDDSQSQDGLQVGIDIRSESRANGNGVEDVKAWSPPRQIHQEWRPATLYENLRASNVPAVAIPVRSRGVEEDSQDFDLPPLPSSPCPSEGMEHAEEGDADDVTELGYISPADSDSEIVNIQQFDIFGQFSPRRKINTQKCYEAGAAYWHRTRLSQGVYALNQWVVKSQTVLTMNDILFEFQALRKLRRGFRTLRNNAIL